MKRFFFFLIVIYGLVLSPACASKKTAVLFNDKPDEKAEVIRIKPEEALEMLESENPPALIDVREPYEFEFEHIPNAINVPLGGVVKGIEERGFAKDAPLMLYCRSGARSANPAALLLSAGYTKVYDLGGIINWPYETVK